MSSSTIRLWTAALRAGAPMDIGSGEVALLQPKTDDQGSIEFGDGTTDMDVRVYLGSEKEYVLGNVGNKSLDFGEDGGGPDVRLFGATAGSQLLWDASANTLILDAAILGQYRRKAPVAKTTSYQLLEADSGTVFTTEGAGVDINFTLPLVTLTGWHAWFFNTNATEREMKITSTAADMIAKNKADTTTLAFTTAGEQIGNAVWIVSDGTNWLCFVSLADEGNAVTVT